MTQQPNNKPARKLSLEEAVAATESLDQRQLYEFSGLTVFTGIHSDLGSVMVIMPAAGDNLLIFPFASHVS